MTQNSQVESIPLLPISDMDSLEATLVLGINGLVKGERTQGALNGRLVVDGEKSKITVSGNLLGEIAAQIGGAVIGLFTPRSIDFYKMPDGPYVAINGFMPVCVKPQSAKATAAVNELSPEGLLAMLTAPEVARGRNVGEATLNGRRVFHYIVDGTAFIEAARASSDPKLRAFGAGLWSAEDADLYVDAAGGFPVALNGQYRGAYEPLGFIGDFGLQVELTATGTGTPVNLPAPCAQPINL